MVFTQLKNIDRAFQHIKRFSIVFLVCCVLLTSVALYCSFSLVRENGSRIFILHNGKLLEAISADRKQNLPVEMRDHISTFHRLFFTLDPDEKAISAGIAKALYLADGSAKKAYDNLKESGYYNNLISANISQHIEIDSIALSLDHAPYGFTCYATQKLIRSSSTVVRKLVTRGELRVLESQTDNNPHGFLIQKWETLVNADVNPKMPEP
ncbi:conjugative transposon protein TraK [Pedobacter soli]|uniref:Bacteroides conjugative transposon TraK protein n=1 Tax=Pedobacter soli TaxID=390242 RepID=A0A1G6WMM3_9SPHI|nr:conjugative transposon protein TraK [Pedobacter soli]SDD67210.1 Bacteroides conjugative transposon TraK protein [Pedobacter soli]